MYKYLAAVAAVTLVSAPAWAAEGHHPIKDSYITAKVKAELVADSDTDADNIHVTTRHGVVTLRGIVRSKAEKDEAKRDAMKIDGVREVRDELKTPG
jgi:hyperosmotically inducible periplasmic protein